MDGKVIKSSKTYFICGDVYQSEGIRNGTIDINDYPKCAGIEYPTKYYYVVYNNNECASKEVFLYDEEGSDGVKDGCILSKDNVIEENAYIKKSIYLNIGL